MCVRLDLWARLSSNHSASATNNRSMYALRFSCYLGFASVVVRTH